MNELYLIKVESKFFEIPNEYRIFKNRERFLKGLKNTEKNFKMKGIFQDVKIKGYKVTGLEEIK